MARTLAAVLLALAVVGCGRVTDDPPARDVAGAVTPQAQGEAPTTTTPAPPDHRRQIVHLRRPTTLRATPGGRAIARLAPRTEFDSPTVLPVLRRRGDWYGVLAPHLPNGRIGWISARAQLTSYATEYRIVASLRRREVVVRRAGRIVQRFRVAIGSPATPTPTGRFAVTDKLLTRDAASPYGCCILALSARQPLTPQGWGGGDRVAIHATSLPETIGTEASLGCLRGPEDALRRAVRTVPLGTLVRIKS